MNERDVKNSPFYIEYTGKTKVNGKWIKTYGYHVKEDFNKPLKEFLDERFGADASDSAIIEQIVYDYYFRYAHYQTYYGKTIVALMHKKQLNSANPRFIPLFVLDRFVRDNEDNLIDEQEIDKEPINEFIAWNKPFKDIDADLEKKIVSLIVNEGFDIDGYQVFQELKGFDADRLKDFYVLEIPLNNHLDVKRNGVFCFETDDGVVVENMHVGVAIVKDSTNESQFVLVYRWNLNDAFDVDIYNCVISKVSLSTFESLCEKYNYVMCVVLNLFKRTDFSVDFKLKENRKNQDELKAQLEDLKQQEQMYLDIKNAKLNKDK